MLVRIALAFLLLSPALAAQDDSLITVAGSTADSLLQTLPRDSGACATVGILFTNKVFLKQTNDGKRDADSAIAYLDCALAYSWNPRLQAYAYIARALRASKDGLWAKLLGGTKARATEAFECCDSLARCNPGDLGVQFLAANLFQEGDKLDQKMYYWQRAWDIFADLDACASAADPFFTPEVRGNILLNQGKLMRKLRLDGKASDARADTLWQQAIRLYPNTNAATNALLQRKKL